MMHGGKGVGGINENSLVTLQSVASVQGAPTTGELTTSLGYTTEDYDYLVAYVHSNNGYPGEDLQLTPGIDPMTTQYSQIQYQTPVHTEGFKKVTPSSNYTDLTVKSSSSEILQMIVAGFRRTVWSGFLNSPSASFDSQSTANGTIPSAVTGLSRTAGNHTLFVSVMCVYGDQWTSASYTPSGYTYLDGLEQDAGGGTYMTMVANYRWIEAGGGNDDNGTESPTGYTAGGVGATTEFIHLLHKYSETP